MCRLGPPHPIPVTGHTALPNRKAPSRGMRERETRRNRCSAAWECARDVTHAYRNSNVTAYPSLGLFLPPPPHPSSRTLFSFPLLSPCPCQNTNSRRYGRFSRTRLATRGRLTVTEGRRRVTSVDRPRAYPPVLPRFRGIGREKGERRRRETRKSGHIGHTVTDAARSGGSRA